MATETIPRTAALSDRPKLTLSQRFAWLAGWRDPWWKPTLGIPLYALSLGLFIGGLLAGAESVLLQSLELTIIAVIAADVRDCRRYIPVLNSDDRAVAAGGWAILLLFAAALAVALPRV